MFHKMSMKNDGLDGKTAKRRKESKLLEVLMAAKALSEIGTEEEKPMRMAPAKPQTPPETSEVEVLECEAEEEQKDAAEEEPEPQKAEGEGDEDDNDGPTTIKTFPEKLMDMLDHEDVTEAITWLPGGKSFSIINPKKFTDDVLPKFFKQSKFESFVRKLYRWGFRQVDKGEVGHITFYHKHFQKGNVALAVAKLRSVTPSKLSNAANKAAKERMAAEVARPGGRGGATFVERPPLPAATQSLLAQLRKERGLALKTGLPTPMRDVELLPSRDLLPPSSGIRTPTEGRVGGLGNSLATRMLLKHQHLAAASSLRPMMPETGPSFLQGHKLAQMHAHAQAVKMQQKASLQNQIRMQAAARWQVQLRHVLGHPGHLSKLAGPHEPMVKPLTPRGMVTTKPALFSNLSAAQPAYGQDIVKAAVDALNNAP